MDLIKVFKVLALKQLENKLDSGTVDEDAVKKYNSLTESEKDDLIDKVVENVFFLLMDEIDERLDEELDTQLNNLI